MSNGLHDKQQNNTNCPGAEKILSFQPLESARIPGVFANTDTETPISSTFLYISIPTFSGENVESVQKCVGVVGV
jgi:hypothetical protein